MTEQPDRPTAQFCVPTALSSSSWQCLLDNLGVRNVFHYRMRTTPSLFFSFKGGYGFQWELTNFCHGVLYIYLPKNCLGWVCPQDLVSKPMILWVWVLVFEVSPKLGLAPWPLGRQAGRFPHSVNTLPSCQSPWTRGNLFFSHVPLLVTTGMLVSTYVILPLHYPRHIILSSPFSEYSLDDSRSRGLQKNPDQLVEGREKGLGRDFQSALDSIWRFRLEILDK